MNTINTVLSNNRPEDFSGDTLIIGLNSGLKRFPKQLEELDSRYCSIISDLLTYGVYEANRYKTYLITVPFELPIHRIILAGLGKSDETTPDDVRKSAGAAIKVAQSYGGKVGIYYPELPDSYSKEAILSAMYEGILLGLYDFDKFKTRIKKKDKKSIASISFLFPDEKINPSYRKTIKDTEIVCDAVYFGRDLINSPGNVFTTRNLAVEARKIGKSSKVRTTVYTEKALKSKGLNSILAVGGGSTSPPMMIILEYNGAAKNKKPLVLVGKGVTFDSGGLSLKPALNMEEMKQDMAGAGAVLSAFKSAVDLKLTLNLIAIIPTVENMPSGSSYRPGDVITTYSGITVEVINTDAEGRIILADALSFANNFKPLAVIDVATLTGAAKIALGTVGCAVLSEDEKLIEQVMRASDNTGEKAWRLPMWNEFDKQIKSHIADIRNSGGKEGGTITAAKFLANFTKGYRWLHIDIANVDYASSENEIWKKGATGFGIRLLIDLLRNWKG
ncbi:MAG: leucyl aminopeptidase [candidate division Zixibacteria bacterium]|nr:leucyl aminopeptidase [candidate division Zixibacteria bacterium]